jgi:UDPglucose 6-dehydrogenase
VAQKNKIKIYGYGWVGKHMHSLFPDAVIVDPNLGYTSNEDCDIAFVCVPTPLKDDRLDISIVDDVVSKSQENLIVIRSTLNPEDTDKLINKYYKRIVFQPEYLGETPNHPYINAKTRPFMIIGGKSSDRRKLIELYTTVYNANITIRQVTALEAEIIKLSENRAIAFKVMQCQELYDACEAKGIDYYTIRDAVYGDDPRFTLWFTMIYEARGFNNSKCIKKDVTAWCSYFTNNNQITKLLLKKSDDYDNILH